MTVSLSSGNQRRMSSRDTGESDPDEVLRKEAERLPASTPISKAVVITFPIRIASLWFMDKKRYGAGQSWAAARWIFVSLEEPQDCIQFHGLTVRFARSSDESASPACLFHLGVGRGTTWERD